MSMGTHLASNGNALLYLCPAGHVATWADLHDGGNHCAYCGAGGVKHTIITLPVADFVLPEPRRSPMRRLRGRLGL